MVRIIAAKELREQLRDSRFRLSLALVLLLLITALLSGWSYQQRVSAERTVAQEAQRRQWLEQGEKNPHSAAHFGIYAFKPEGVLALVDRGLEPWLGVSSWLEAHKQNDFQHRPARDGTAIQRFGALSAAGVLQQLVPLLILVLCAPLIAGERESGTLKQVLSLGVRPRTLLFGKALGILTALTLLAVPCTLMGSLVLWLGSSSSLDTDTLVRFGLMGAVYGLYLAGFVAMGLAISAIAPSTRVALLASIGFWILSSLLLPRVMADVSRQVYPLPSSNAFKQAIDRDIAQGIDGHGAEDERVEQLKQEVLARYGVGKVEDLPINFDAVRMQAGEEYGNRVFDTHYGSLWHRLEQQDSVQSAAGLIAPIIPVRTLSAALAGTDHAHHLDFARSAEAYRRGLVKQMNDHLATYSRTGQWDYKASQALWEQVPAFEYRRPEVSWALREAGASVPALMAWFSISVGLALLSARRLSPL